ncbi:MAG TPA: hypothetical protein VI603_10345 [Saprospiraceae bacterium]|nr:hypothetical protein [Saprospiraceae bacterium]
MKVYLFSFIFFIAYTVKSYTQTIRGFIYDNATHQPIAQANVFITGDGGTIQLESDDNGQFLYEPKHGGRFDVIISHLSYELVHLQALQLSSTKDVVLEIPMTARIRELTEVNILAASVRSVNNRFYTTTEEETRRFPATFFDPARTATLFPGIYAANDQANGLVINGLSPALMQWYLEGIPILNPNHLANAGTLSDRSSATGGGVNMLSNQVLATTSLVTGALPARYGDAVSGVMDMQFRPGNVRKPEHTVQVGLLGIDFGTEGRLKKDSEASYLVNYRYSTIGLLSALGVDFGDEKINFQDLNFNIHYPLSVQGGYVKVFGLGGISKTDLDGPKEPAERMDSRDISKVEYDAGAAIGGATLQYPMRKGVIKATMAISYTKSDRAEDRLGPTALLPYSNELSKQTKFSTRVDWQGQRSNRLTVNGGVGLTYYSVNANGGYPQSGPFVVKGNTTLFRPYTQVSYVVTGDVVLRGGLAISILSGRAANDDNSSGTIVPEPSLHVYWQAGEKFSIETGYSFSGMTTPQVTFQQGSMLDLDLLRTHTFSFVFRDQIRSSTQLAGIINYYALTHVPADADIMSNYTILSEAGYPRSGPFSLEGKGRTISLALALRQDVYKGTFARAGIGWVHATHQGSSGILFSTAYDTGPWASFTGGKEWTSGKEYGDRVFGLNGGMHWRGGLRDQEIDLEESRAAGYTVYDDEGNFVIEVEDYFRIDLRVYLKKDKINKTATWSLDVQNLLSRENAFFSLYDPFLDAIRQTKQLGIIPVLSYRVDF